MKKRSRSSYSKLLFFFLLRYRTLERTIRRSQPPPPPSPSDSQPKNILVAGEIMMMQWRWRCGGWRKDPTGPDSRTPFSVLRAPPRDGRGNRLRYLCTAQQLDGNDGVAVVDELGIKHNQCNPHETYQPIHIHTGPNAKREKLRATNPVTLPDREAHEWRSEDFERKRRSTNVKHITMETLTPPLICLRRPLARGGTGSC